MSHPVSSAPANGDPGRQSASRGSLLSNGSKEGGRDTPTLSRRAAGPCPSLELSCGPYCAGCQGLTERGVPKCGLAAQAFDPDWQRRSQVSQFSCVKNRTSHHSTVRAIQRAPPSHASHDSFDDRVLCWVHIPKIGSKVIHRSCRSSVSRLLNLAS